MLILPFEAKVGDAILIRDPFRPERLHVRRLIGLEGDKIVYEKNGTILRNDKRITQRDMGTLGKGQVIEEEVWDGEQKNRKRYIWRQQKPILLEYDAVVVAKEKMYVLAENRDSGVDSRYWGTLPKEDLLGVICLRIGSSTPWFGGLTWYP